MIKLSDSTLRWSQRLAPLTLVLLVAAVFRLYWLDRLPPGLYYDEAYNGVDVRSILSGAGLPLFLPGNYGREAFYIYLQALAVAALGYSTYALRFTSALIGILTVGIVYWGAHTLWRYRPGLQQGDPTPMKPQRIAQLRWVAFVAAAGLAVLYWHVSLSRLGFRAVLLTPVSMAALVFFWRAWCTGSLRDFGWAGFWFGLALYTYSSARFLPFVPAAFVAVEWLLLLIRRARRQQSGSFRLRGLLLLLGIALLTILPLLVALARQPELVALRVGELSIFGAPAESQAAKEPLGRLILNLTNFGRWLYTTGDFIPRHNLPYRPVHDPALALLFTIGLLTAVWRIREARHRLILLWFFIMALPMVLSVPSPHTLRGVGMLAPLTLFYGAAAATIWELARTPRWRMAAGTGVVLLVVLAGVSTARDYFQLWAQHPQLGKDFDLDLEAAATYVQGELPAVADGAPIVLSRRLYLTPEMRFAIGALPWTSPPAAPIPLPPTTRVLVESDADPNQAAFLIHNTDAGPAVTLLEGLPAVSGAPTQVLESPLHLPAWPTVSVYSGQPVTVTKHAIQYPISAQFANGLRFLGYEARPAEGEDPLAPETYELTTYWQAQPGAGPFNEGLVYLFAHMVYPNGQPQRNGALGRSPHTQPLYPISLWQPGEVIDDRRLITVPADAAGKAYFEIGLFNPLSPGGLDRVAILNDAGEAVADQIQFGVVPLRIETPHQDLSALEPLGINFEDRIRLEGWQLQADPAAPEQLRVDLGWRTLDRMPTDYTAFIHVLDKDGAILGQVDLPPGGADNPTARWLPDETVRTVAQVALPAAASVNATALRIGLYEPVSGRQLAISAADPALADSGATFIIVPIRELLP